MITFLQLLLNIHASSVQDTYESYTLQTPTTQSNSKNKHEPSDHSTQYPVPNYIQTIPAQYNHQPSPKILALPKTPTAAAVYNAIHTRTRL